MGYGRYVQWLNGASKPDCTSWMSGDCSQIDEKERKKQRKIMEYRQKQKNPLWGKKPKRIFLELVKLYLIFIKQWYNI